MAGEVNCIFTKALIPFIEREVGPEGVAAILRTAGRSRQYLIADHNWIPLSLAEELVRLAMELMGEPDVDRWARCYGEYFMDWKPSREERSYLGTYTMGIGSPRALYERIHAVYRQQSRCYTLETLALGRRHGLFRWTPLPGFPMPRWVCTWLKVQFERFPTNWGLPRAQILERRCAARGAEACLWEVRWKNPPLGVRFWALTAGGAAGAGLLWVALGIASPVSWPGQAALAVLPALSGVAVGYALRERHRRRHTQRLLDLQAEEVIYSNIELEKKFQDLETKVEQLSLLIDLSAAVNATLDPEKIYEQALHRLVHRMGYQGAYLFLVDPRHRLVRGHKMAGGALGLGAQFEGLEFPLDGQSSLAARVAATGMPVTVNDVEAATEPVHLPTARSLNVRSLVAVPLRVKERTFAVLAVASSEPDRFAEADVELLSAVANHVSLAVDRADSFQTIEELTRGLEDKVRVRTEQLRAANEELQARNRELTQALERETATSEILRVINASPTTVEPVFDAILDNALRLCKSEYGFLFLVEGGAFRRVAHRGVSAEAIEGRQGPIRFGPHTGVARAVAERRPVHILDVKADRAYVESDPNRVRTVEVFGARTGVWVPLLKEGAAVGVIAIWRREVQAFTPTQIELLSTFADQAVIAIENVRLFQELQVAYRELQAAQMQLVQREKMASVGQLVAGVAHELNNPIGFVSSNVATLEDFVGRLRAMLETYRAVGLSEADRGRIQAQWAALKVDYALKYLDSMIQGIREGAERARKIVRDLRVFARGQDEAWQTVDLREELESSLTLVNHLLKDRVTVHRKFGDLPAVECIRSQIDQVFLNLLANAAQAITGEGTISIETRQEDDRAVVEVSDSGPGIPPEVIDRIFDPFFTTKPVGEGTGLGLSISYEIVKKHRGELRAENAPGQGARFTVRLPITRAA